MVITLQKLEQGFQKCQNIGQNEMVIIGHPKGNTKDSILKLESFVSKNFHEHSFTTFESVTWLKFDLIIIYLLMLLPKTNTPRWVIIIIDLLLSLTALFVAYLIRFDLKAEDYVIAEEWAILSKSIIIFIGVKYIIFYLFKIHKGLVRHTSTEDLKRIMSATLFSSIIFAILGYLRFMFYDGYYLFPKSVLVIEFLASSMFLLGSRFLVKIIYLESNKSKDIENRVLIYGAGVSGMMTKRTIQKDTLAKEAIIGFIDDNKKNIWKSIRRDHYFSFK